ncbi:MAG: peptide chain release factor N(5)-glutamine methyltransferase [Fibrobacterota bacterium]
MTLLEILKKTEGFFRGRGLDSPRLDAELLLAHLLRCKRLDLYLQYDKPLTPAETDAYRELVRRRGNREPLQYVIGRAPFLDFEVAVRPGVLIPRPETEILAQAVFSDNPDLSGKQILDLCTGSGVLALALKRRYPDAAVTGSDISPDALALARANGAGLDIEWILSDRFVALMGRTFDLMTVNPPYVRRTDLAGLEPEVRDHEPGLALDGGEDGLDFYRAFLNEAPAYLAAGGRAYLEMGAGQVVAVTGLAQEAGFLVVRVEKDLSGIERVAVLQQG